MQDMIELKKRTLFECPSLDLCAKGWRLGHFEKHDNLSEAENASRESITFRVSELRLVLWTFALWTIHRVQRLQKLCRAN